MKSGVVSWWMDAHLGCLQLSNRPQRCQGVLCWPQMPLHYRNCNWLDAQALARCMPPALCVLLLERGLDLTDPQSEDVRPLTAVNDTIARRRRNRFVLRANQMLGWDGQTIGHTPEKIHITWMSAPENQQGFFWLISNRGLHTRLADQVVCCLPGIVGTGLFTQKLLGSLQCMKFQYSS